jgi:hypothetical protein
MLTALLRREHGTRYIEFGDALEAPSETFLIEPQK